MENKNNIVQSVNFPAKLEVRISKNGNKYVCIVLPITNTYSKMVVDLNGLEKDTLKQIYKLDI